MRRTVLASWVSVTAVAVGLALGGCSGPDAASNEGASGDDARQESVGASAEASPSNDDGGSGSDRGASGDRPSPSDGDAGNAGDGTDPDPVSVADIPLPAGATVLEEQSGSPESGGESYRYLQVEGELETVMGELAAQLAEAGFGEPEIDLTEDNGRLRATGNGHEVRVDARVSDDNIRVLQVSYQVSRIR